MAESGWPILDFVLEHGGEDAATRLIRERGGVTTCIPAEPPEGHWLEEYVGREKARELCRELSIISAGGHGPAGGVFMIPLAWEGRVAKACRQNRERVLDLSKQGWSIRRIALDIGATTRNVKLHRAKLRKQGRLPPSNRP